MTTETPTRGNRSSGTLGDYMLGISRGETLDQIGKRYSVTAGAVRKALKTHGLPTCAADYLRWRIGRPDFSLPEAS